MTKHDTAIIDKAANLDSVRVLADAVSEAIKENKGDQRFIDVTKIPLICLSIANINQMLSEIKDMIVTNKSDSDIQHEKFLTKDAFHLEFDPVKSLVFGAVGIALIAMGGALVSVILKS